MSRDGRTPWRSSESSGADGAGDGWVDDGATRPLEPGSSRDGGWWDPDAQATQVIRDPEATEVRGAAPRHPSAVEGDPEATQVLEDPDATRVLGAGSHPADPSATRVLDAPGAPGSRRDASAAWLESPHAPGGAGTYGEEEPARVLSGEQLRAVVVARQKEEYARVQLLPGLLGWLAALPLTGFLVWLAQQALPRFGVGPAPESSGAALSGLGAGEADAGMWVLAYAVAVFLGYLGGGYAAGRAARFGGAKQGVGVFLWFLMITAVSSIVVQALGLPAAGGTMPVAAQDYGGANLGWTGLTVAGTALIALAAATLGGWWGTAYHRRADRWGFQAF
ncbi:hypothetical protein I6H58_07985 [Rothia kristinae]|uniref:Uncharacterized protein n=1 Tax=Rothia kristinae TaxID=37923 RepID=A0A7T4MSP1_9MICC|nr:hypothetical protein [Rothia kristinae]QQC58898.1 hypothetical protein I6H58_07985 [Rothia kristinae]